MFGMNSTMRFELRDSQAQNKQLIQQIHQQRDQITEFSNRLQDTENNSVQFETQLYIEHDNMKLLRQKLAIEKKNNLILAQNFNKKMNVLNDVQYQLQKEEIKTNELTEQLFLEKKKSVAFLEEKRCNKNIIQNEAVTFEKINHVISLLTNDKSLKHYSDIDKENDPNLKLQMLLDELSVRIERGNRRNSMDHKDATQLAISFQEEDDSLQMTIKKLRDERSLNSYDGICHRRRSLGQSTDSDDFAIESPLQPFVNNVSHTLFDSPREQRTTSENGGTPNSNGLQFSEVSPYDRYEEPKILQWLSHDGAGETAEWSEGAISLVLDGENCRKTDELLIPSDHHIELISDETNIEIGCGRASLSPMSSLLLKQKLLDELSVEMLAGNNRSIDHEDVTDMAMLFQQEEDNLESIIQKFRDEKSLSLSNETCPPPRSLGQSTDSDDFAIESPLLPFVNNTVFGARSSWPQRTVNDDGGLSNSNGLPFSEVSPYDRYEEPKILQWLSHDGAGETADNIDVECEILLPSRQSLASSISADNKTAVVSEELMFPIDSIHPEEKVFLSGEADTNLLEEGDLLSPESTSQSINSRFIRQQDTDQMNARIDIESRTHTEKKAIIQHLRNQIIQIDTNNVSEKSELDSVHSVKSDLQSKFSPYSESDMRIKSRSGKFDSHWIKSMYAKINQFEEMQSSFSTPENSTSPLTPLSLIEPSVKVLVKQIEQIKVTKQSKIPKLSLLSPVRSTSIKSIKGRIEHIEQLQGKAKVTSPRRPISTQFPIRTLLNLFKAKDEDELMIRTTEDYEKPHSPSESKFTPTRKISYPPPPFIRSPKSSPKTPPKTQIPMATKHLTSEQRVTIGVQDLKGRRHTMDNKSGKINTASPRRSNAY